MQHGRGRGKAATTASAAVTCPPGTLTAARCRCGTVTAAAGALWPNLIAHPWITLRPMSMAYAPRMVPGSEARGLVAPMILRA